MDTSAIHELTGPALEPFLPLLGEIESGSHFDEENPRHLEWLRFKLDAHLARGTRYFGQLGGSNSPLGVLGVVIDHKLFCGPTAEIVDIGIIASRRGNGLGRALLEFAVDLVQPSGASSIFVRTYAGDEGVIAFYGRNGFHPVAVIPGTNGVHDEGTIVMRKTLAREHE